MARPTCIKRRGGGVVPAQEGGRGPGGLAVVPHLYQTEGGGVGRDASRMPLRLWHWHTSGPGFDSWTGTGSGLDEMTKTGGGATRNNKWGKTNK